MKAAILLRVRTAPKTWRSGTIGVVQDSAVRERPLRERSSPAELKAACVDAERASGTKERR